MKKYTGKISEDSFDYSKMLPKEEFVVLHKQKENDFIILNLTDMHFSDYDYRFFTAFECEATIKKLIKDVKPDLITITGDIVCTEHTFHAINRITKFIDSFGIPWAPVFGNHDDEGDCDLNFLADTMINSKYCIMKKGDERMGVGNYAVLIEEENNIKELLVMLDSHHSQPNELQCEWIKSISESVKYHYSKSPEISLFMHIPLPIYSLLYSIKEELDYSGECNEDVACDNCCKVSLLDNQNICNGLMLDSRLCLECKNDKYCSFSDLSRLDNIKYVFCGHDHLNNITMLCNGIRFTYCLKLGLGSGAILKFNGGTVIKINSKGIKQIFHKTKRLNKIKTILTVDSEV